MADNMESPVKAPLMIEPLMPGEVLTLPDGQTVGVGDEPEPLVIEPDHTEPPTPTQSTPSQADSKRGLVNDSQVRKTPKLEKNVSPVVKPRPVDPNEVLEIIDSDDEDDVANNISTSAPTSTATRSPATPSNASHGVAAASVSSSVSRQAGVPQKQEKIVAEIKSKFASVRTPNTSTSTPSRQVPPTPTQTPTSSSPARTTAAATKGKAGAKEKEKFFCSVLSCKKQFSSKMEGYVHWNINHDFNAICFTCKDCSSVKSWPREPFIGHINQAHKRPYTNVLDVIDSKFVDPQGMEPPDGYENWCNEKIYPKRSGHISVSWKPQGIQCPVARCTSKDKLFTDPVEFFEHWKLVHRVETEHYVCKDCPKGVVFQTKYKKTLLKHIERAHLAGDNDANPEDHLVVEVCRNLEYLDPYPYTMKKNDKAMQGAAKAADSDKAPAAEASGATKDKSPGLKEKPRITYKTIRKVPEPAATQEPTPSVSNTSTSSETPVAVPSKPLVVPSRTLTPNDIVLNTDTDQYMQWSDTGICCPVPKCNNLHLGFKRDFVKHWQEFHTGSGVIYECPACPPGNRFTSNRLGQTYTHIREEHVKHIPEKLRDKEKNRILGTVKMKENQNDKFIDPAPFQMLISEETLKDPKGNDTLTCPGYNCDVAVTSYEELTAHWKEIHLPTVIALPCPMCGIPMDNDSYLKKHVASECPFKPIYDSDDIKIVQTKNIVQNPKFSHPGRFSSAGDTLKAIQKAFSEAKADEAIYHDFSGVGFTWTLKSQGRKDFSVDIVGKMVSANDEKQPFTFKENMRCPVNKCPTFLKGAELLREHWVECHVQFSIHYACPVSEKCKEKFKGASGLEAHLKHAHKSSQMSVGDAVKKAEAFYLANDAFIEPDVLPPSNLPPKVKETPTAPENDDDDDDDPDFGGFDNYDPQDDDDDDDDDVGGGEDYDDSDTDTTWTPGGRTQTTKEKLRTVLTSLRRSKDRHAAERHSMDSDSRSPPPKRARSSTRSTASPAPSPAPAPVPSPVAVPTPAPVKQSPAPARPSPAPAVRPSPAPVARPSPAPVARPSPSPVPLTKPSPAPVVKPTPTPVVKQEPMDTNTSNTQEESVAASAPVTRPPKSAADSAPSEYKFVKMEEVRFEPGFCCPVKDCKCTRIFKIQNDFATHWELVHLEFCEQYLCPLCPQDNPTQFREKLFLKDFQVHLRCKMHFGKPVTKSTLMALVRKMKRVMLPNKNYVLPYVAKDRLVSSAQSPGSKNADERTTRSSTSVPNGLPSTPGGASVAAPAVTPPTKSSFESLIRDTLSPKTAAVPKDSVSSIKRELNTSSNTEVTRSPSGRIIRTRASGEGAAEKQTEVAVPPKVSGSTSGAPAAPAAAPAAPKQGRTARKRTAAPARTNATPVATAVSTPTTAPPAKSGTPAGTPVAKDTVLTGQTSQKASKPGGMTARKRTAGPPPSAQGPSTQGGSSAAQGSAVQASTAQAPAAKAVKVGQAVLKAPADYLPVPQGYRVLSDDEGVELPPGPCPVKDCKETVTDNFKRHWEIFHKPSSLYICCPLCPAHSRFSIRTTVDINSLSRHIAGTHEKPDSPANLIRDTLSKVLKVMMKNPKYLRPLVLVKDFPAAPPPAIKAVESPASKVQERAQPTVKPQPANGATSAAAPSTAPSASGEGSSTKGEKSGDAEKKTEPISRHYPNLVGYEEIVERGGRQYYRVKREDIIFVAGSKCPVEDCGKGMLTSTGLQLHWLFKHEPVKVSYVCPVCPQGSKQFRQLTLDNKKFVSHLKQSHSIKNSMRKMKSKRSKNAAFLEPLVPVNPASTRSGGQKRKLDEVDKTPAKTTPGPGRPPKKARMTPDRSPARDSRGEDAAQKSTGEVKKEKGKPGRKPKVQEKLEDGSASRSPARKQVDDKITRSPARKLDDKLTRSPGRKDASQLTKSPNRSPNKSAVKLPNKDTKESSSKQETVKDSKEDKDKKPKHAEIVVLHRMSNKEIENAKKRLRCQELVECYDTFMGVPGAVLQFDGMKHMPRSEAGLKAYVAWLTNLKSSINSTISASKERLKFWKGESESEVEGKGHKQDSKDHDSMKHDSEELDSGKYESKELSVGGTLSFISGETQICEIKFGSPQRKVSPNTYHVACAKTKETIQIENINQGHYDHLANKSSLPKFDITDVDSMPRLSIEDSRSKSSSPASVPSMPSLSDENSHSSSVDKSDSTMNSGKDITNSDFQDVNKNLYHKSELRSDQTLSDISSKSPKKEVMSPLKNTIIKDGEENSGNLLGDIAQHLDTEFQSVTSSTTPDQENREKREEVENKPEPMDVQESLVANSEQPDSTVTNTDTSSAKDNSIPVAESGLDNKSSEGDKSDKITVHNEQSTVSTNINSENAETDTDINTDVEMDSQRDSELDTEVELDTENESGGENLPNLPQYKDSRTENGEVNKSNDAPFLSSCDSGEAGQATKMADVNSKHEGRVPVLEKLSNEVNKMSPSLNKMSPSLNKMSPNLNNSNLTDSAISEKADSEPKSVKSCPTQ